MIRKGQFREDLFYRLNVIKIELPSLRERKEDIPLLAKHFLDVYSRENDKRVAEVSDEVMTILEDYDWPGNIRELENLIERAVVLTKTESITRENLPPMLLGPQIHSTPAFTPFDGPMHRKDQTRMFQRQAIIHALKKTRGIQKKAAGLLGVKPTTLNEMIKRLEIDLGNLPE